VTPSSNSNSARFTWFYPHTPRHCQDGFPADHGSVNSTGESFLSRQITRNGPNHEAIGRASSPYRVPHAPATPRNLRRHRLASAADRIQDRPWPPARDPAAAKRPPSERRRGSLGAEDEDQLSLGIAHSGVARAQSRSSLALAEILGSAYPGLPSWANLCRAYGAGASGLLASSASRRFCLIRGRPWESAAAKRSDPSLRSGFPLGFARGRLRRLGRPQNGSTSLALSREAPSRSLGYQVQQTHHLRGGLIYVAPTALARRGPPRPRHPARLVLAGHP